MSTDLSLHQFYAGIKERISKNPNERYGQAAFNYLCEVRPDLSERVRTTVMDPFYIRTTDDPRWVKFVKFIETEWYKN